MERQRFYPNSKEKISVGQAALVGTVLLAATAFATWGLKTGAREDGSGPSQVIGREVLEPKREFISDSSRDIAIRREPTLSDKDVIGFMDSGIPVSVQAACGFNYFGTRTIRVDEQMKEVKPWEAGYGEAEVCYVWYKLTVSGAKDERGIPTEKEITGFVKDLDFIKAKGQK